MTRALLLSVCALLLVPIPAEAAKRKTQKKSETTTEVKVEEVGILKNQDVRVVQKNLYAKKGRHEFGFLLSTQPWDAYTAGFMLGFNSTLNPSERLGFELALQGGYGFGNGHYRDVTFLGNSAGGTLTGLGTDAVRQLFGGGANLVFSPIYAKLAWGTRKVIHFDVNFVLGFHAFLAQRLEADEGFAAVIGPTAGLGLKFFLSPKVALKIDLRDNIALERRAYTGKFTARNNFQFGLGLAFYLNPKKG